MRGSEKYTGAGIIFIYASDEYSQAYKKIASYFRHLAKKLFYNNTWQKKVP